MEALKSVGDLKIRIGSQDLILKRGANIEDEGRVVWQDPVGDSKNIATAYRKTTGGLNSINRMNELLNLMGSEAEGQLGGTAAQGLFDKAKEVARSIGMDLGPYTGGEDVSPRVQYEKLSNALLANFKRYLTSETGNGISTYDVQQIEKAFDVNYKNDKKITIEERLKDTLLKKQSLINIEKQNTDLINNIKQILQNLISNLQNYNNNEERNMAALDALAYLEATYPDMCKLIIKHDGKPDLRLNYKFNQK